MNAYQAISRRKKRGPGIAYSVRKDVIGFDLNPAIQTDDETMSATFVVSSETQDRDGDIVRLSGIDLKSYAANPVVFFGHQLLPFPIAICEDGDGEFTVSKSAKELRATVFFDPADPDARFIYGKVKGGFLRATSIGFRAIEAEKIESGWEFKKSELLEISIVGVPSNPDALYVENEAGISDSLRKAIAGLSPPPEIVPMTTQERAEFDSLKSALAATEIKLAALVAKAEEDADKKPEGDGPKEEKRVGVKYLKGVHEMLTKMHGFHKEHDGMLEHPGVAKACKKMMDGTQGSMDDVMKSGRKAYPDVFGEDESNDADDDDDKEKPEEEKGWDEILDAVAPLTKRSEAMTSRLNHLLGKV